MGSGVVLKSAALVSAPQPHPTCLLTASTNVQASTVTKSGD